MSFPSDHTGKPGWEKVTTTNRFGRLAEEMYIYPGRWFRYVLAGEAVSSPYLQTSISAIDNHDLDLVVATAAAIGDTT